MNLHDILHLEHEGLDTKLLLKLQSCSSNSKIAAAVLLLLGVMAGNPDTKEYENPTYINIAYCNTRGVCVMQGWMVYCHIMHASSAMLLPPCAPA